MAGLDLSSLKPVGAQQQGAAPATGLDVSKLRPAHAPAPAEPVTEPQTSPIEDVGFAASRVGTAIPHLAEFALDVPQHLGAAAQWGVSGEMTGVSADRPDTAQNFDTFAAGKLGAPDFKAFPARGYEPTKLSELYKEFLDQAPNAELKKRLTTGRRPEAYKAPLIGTDIFGGQLGAAAEGIKDVTGGAVDLNRAFPEAKNKKQQLIEGVTEGVVTGGTSIPRSIVRAAVPQLVKKATQAEANSLRREIVTDMLTGGVGGYTGTLAAQNAPEGWELPAGLAGGMAGGLGAIGVGKVTGATADKVGGYLRPAITTKGNIQRMAGEALRNAATDPNRAVEAMGAATAPEGVDYTTGQASQDIGLLSLEQSLARGKDQKFREAMVQRAREQNMALANTVRGIEQGASPSSMSTFFHDRMGQLNERLDQLDANARKLAEQEAAGLETPDAGDVGGNIQEVLAGEMDRVKQEVAALDKAVDPTGTMRLPTGRLRAAANDLYAKMSDEEKLSIAPEETALLNVINRYGDTLPYQRFRDLRTQLNEDMRNARGAGKGRAYGRLSQLRGALEADIGDAISGRFAREANAANEFVARARDWYERGAEAPARTGAAASPVGAAPGAAPAVPPRAGEPSAAGREPGAVAADSGLSEDAAARAAVEGRRFSQGEIIQLGERREQKKLEGFHRGLMDQIGDQVRASREATAAAREKGMFEGFNVGERLRSQNHKGEPLPPMKIEGVFMREWNPNRVPPMFERLGIKPTIAEYNGKQYVPMIRYSTGEAPPAHLNGAQVDRWVKDHPDQDWSRSETYLDAVRDRKMGGPMRLAQSEVPAEPKPAFYSAALKSVEDSKTNRASPQQWAATIKNTPGVKQEEIDWLGLTPWLAAQKGAVTKEQIADFIRANQIEVEEVNLAGTAPEDIELPRYFDWKPDDIDEDFVRELAREDAVDQADDLREQFARREGIEPEEVTDDQIEHQAFENQMRYRENDPDGYHTSVVVDVPDGQVVYDISRGSDGYTNIRTDRGDQVVDGADMDEVQIRDAIRRDIEENHGGTEGADGATQYEDYTLPGGKDYHELLLKLPERAGIGNLRPSAAVQAKYKDQWDEIALQIDDLPPPSQMTPEDRRLETSLYARQDGLHQRMVDETKSTQAPWRQGDDFDAPHYDDQKTNILAHVRFKDRTSTDGKRTLFLEEVQSDWHQQGRDKGYKPENPDTERLRELQVAQDAAIREENRVKLEAAREASGGEFETNTQMTDALYLANRHAQRLGVDSGHLWNEPSEAMIARGDFVSPEKLAAVRAEPEVQKGARAREAISKYAANPEVDRVTKARDAASAAWDQENQKQRLGVPDAPFKTTWPELALKRMIRWAADNGYDQIAWTPGSVQNKRYGLSSKVNQIDWSPMPDGGAEKLVKIWGDRNQQYRLMVDPEGKVVNSPQGMDLSGKPLAEVIGKDLAAQIMADAKGQITKEGLAEIGGSGMREFYDRVLVSLGNKLGKKFGTQVGKTKLRIPVGFGESTPVHDIGGGMPGIEAAALPITDAMREGAKQGFPLFQKVNEAATSPLNDLPQPTEAQKLAGNYKKGRVRLGGLDISIENPAGSKRSGKDASGKPWSVDLKDHYGYIRGTVGKDKDHLDTFVSREAGELGNDSPVFVVNQLDPKSRKFDEHKIMLGYPNRAAAEAAYKANYAKDWQGMGSIIPTTLGALKSWIADGNTKRPFEQRSIPDAQGNVGAAGVRSVPGEAAPAAGNAGREADGSLRGLPRKVGSLTASAYPAAQRVAAAYMNLAGLEYRPPNTYAKVNPERATRIASAYDEMEHNPSDPEVQRAYKAMADETLAQYQAMLDDDVEIEFIPPGRPDPYAGNPRNMTEDVRKNKHMWVFATRDGFGSDATFDVSDNPLLGESGFEISGQPATINDIFRAVHDYFGHVKEGVGFRADGEENAWRAHSAMYSPEARRAMTSETRGQNSWVNYGPFGESNRTAKSEATHYADQKIGLLPEWVAQEGAGDDTIADTMAQRFASAGRPEPEAKAAGQIVEAFYATLANRLGVETDAVQQQFPLPNVGKGAGPLRQGERGSILLGRDGIPALISLYETADATTALHESAHQFLDMFSRVADGKGVPEGLLRDWNATKAWWQKNAQQLATDAGEGTTAADVRKALAGESLGEKKDAAVARGMHEQWARAFEVYLRDGKAPNAQMKGLFDQFKDWLTQVYKSITGMGVELSPDIRGVFDRMLGAEGGDLIDRPAAKRLSDVTQRWKEYYGTYTDKSSAPVPAIVRKSKGESYPFDMPPEAVTKATWKSGPDGATAIRNILKGAGQDRAAATKGIEQSAMLSLSRAALKDGVVDPAAFDKWKATHSDALAAMPELAKRLSTAADATRAMQRVAKQSLDTRQAVERSAVGSIMKLGTDASDADISRKVGNMLGSQGAVKTMRELVNQARGEPEALAGLRRAVVDYALTQFTREDTLSTAALKRWMSRNRPALEAVLDPEQMKTLNAVVEASDNISNIVRAPGGGSPTTEYLMSLSKREKPSMLREMFSHVVGNAVQSGVAGGIGHALGGLGLGINTAVGAFLSRAGIDALRARGFAKVHDLMLEAILDPQLGRTLMMKAAKEKGKGSARVLERTLASGLIGAIGAGREQARERAATGG